MPAFSFEKLSPPATRAPAAPVVEKRRGVIFQMLDRFVEARVRRVFRGKKPPNSRRTKPHQG
jgi:hypothetical protein